MAHVIAAGNAPAKHSNIFSAFVRKIVEAYQERKAFAALESLDDRLLEDVGLTRGDLLDWQASGRVPRR
ncbi:DUF1127 domain-containing protein [Hwanghaeella sp.]|uniref:DUF1127 domain-containing protein n=1 Tax=Hwanghaeella sp. TaxID=2605943 RepID=UPI003CCC1536